MPQIGWLEILIIVSIAIIVIGPKDFPVMLKKVGSWIGSAKRYFSNIQSEITSLETEDLTAEKKEVIVLASIVQKESIKLDERPIIAGVYLNRIRKKMRLQQTNTMII